MGNGLRKERRSKKRVGEEEEEEERFSRPSQLKIGMEGSYKVGKTALISRFGSVLFFLFLLFFLSLFLFKYLLKDYFHFSFFFSFSQGYFVEESDLSVQDRFEFSSSPL